MILGFFFSRGMSVQKWHQLGLLDREKLIYESHIINGTLDKVYFFTYGEKDYDFLNLLHKKIQIISMPNIFNFKLGIYIYSFLMPFIQAKYIKKCDIFKNDQIDGSWTAVIAKIFFRKKLLIRTGFTLSIFMNRKGSKFKELIAVLVERIAYFFCDFATVSSQHSKDYIKSSYGLDEARVSVVYNYIDIHKFNLINKINKHERFIFVGRLDPQKNLVNLFYAIKDTHVGIDIYGDGALKESLISLSKELGIDVNFFEKVANDKLPRVLNKYKYYILPSFNEGMPKTLIEAMSCGLTCIGTDTIGINEIINTKNGFLITGTHHSDISKVINTVINKSKINNFEKDEWISLRNQFSLERYSLKEAKIFSNLLKI